MSEHPSFSYQLAQMWGTMAREEAEKAVRKVRGQTRCSYKLPTPGLTVSESHGGWPTHKVLLQNEESSFSAHFLPYSDVVTPLAICAFKTELN